jgi:hypothetical protein
VEAVEVAARKDRQRHGPLVAALDQAVAEVLVERRAERHERADDVAALACAAERVVHEL